MDIEKTIRALARSSYWLNLYKSTKELGSIQLFENKENLSSIQSTFLFWLRLYSTLYEDLINEESPFLTEAVLQNDVRCDAYIYYRNREYQRKLRQSKIKEASSKLSKNKKHSAKPTPFTVDIQR